jgi:hypothetical protein
MFVALNQSTVPAESIQPGATRRRLLAGDHREAPGVALERLTLAAGATLRCDTSAKALDWLYLLAGEARLVTGSIDAKIAEGHSATLPPRFKTSLSTAGGASLLRVSIADIARLDRGFPDRQPHFMLIDWTEEPVLAAERDGRKRVALVTPGLCDTEAIRVDMLVYAAGDMSPSHRYEGAATLIYILEGSGTVVTQSRTKARTMARAPCAKTILSASPMATPASLRRKAASCDFSNSSCRERSRPPGATRAWRPAGGRRA